MEHIEKLVAWLAGYQDYSYAIVFAILIGCGFGLPIPEDVVLVSGGIMSGVGDEQHHLMHLTYMLIISFAGVLAGDGTMYLLGRIFGYRIQKFRPMRAILPPSRFAKIQKLFNRYGIWVLFIARFLPVLRSPTFLCAGMSRRVSFFKFLLMDGFAAAISVPIWVLIGHYGAQNREDLAKWLSDGKTGILIFTVLAVSALAIFIYRRNKKEKEAQKRTEEKKAIEENQRVQEQNEHTEPKKAPSFTIVKHGSPKNNREEHHSDGLSD
jgi:membrane protein DedA with SNARE-associated domain